MESLPVEQHQLFTVELDELVPTLRLALAGNFKDVEVNVVECPDLTQDPYRLSAKGLGGMTRLADVGGVPYLAPTPDLTRKYNLNSIADLVGLPDGCLIIGPGAGPFHEIGTNCEYIANAFVSKPTTAQNASQLAYIDQTGNCFVTQPSSTNFAILGNFFICRGETGPVLEIKARHRTGSKNFISCMREELQKRYPGNPVGLGGVFLVKRGNLKLHVMPQFSATPMKTSEDLDSWLKFFTFPAPMLFMSEFVSEDPGWDLRIEHTHGHSPLEETGRCTENHGGHYHEDTSPYDVEYVGYFNVAQLLYRIDRPREHINK